MMACNNCVPAGKTLRDPGCESLPSFVLNQTVSSQIKLDFSARDWSI